MIISSNVETDSAEFERLLGNTASYLESDAKARPEYYISRAGEKLETEVYEVMSKKAIGNTFEGTMKLISGHRFPDIVARNIWGVEVKSTKQDHWKTTGNSVLETTRIENVERIYLLFGKLAEPIGFRYGRYEDCMRGVAVTHSPRYLIDMETTPEDNIFSLMNIDYDDLRLSDKPIQKIIRYYRSILEQGEDLWWLDSGEADPNSQSVTVRLWTNLKKEKKDVLRNQAMALFPEIFGTGNKKYAKLATWLAGSHGIVSPSLRDTFTAGGQVELIVRGRKVKGVPRIFKYLRYNNREIRKYLESLTDDEIEFYWGERVPKNKRVNKWVALLRENTRKSLAGIQLNLKDLIDN